MRAALPLDGRAVGQPQVGLVHERGGLQRVAGPLVGEVFAGHAAQVLVDDGQKLLAGLRLAGAPRLEQAGDLVGGILAHRGWATAMRPPA